MSMYQIMFYVGLVCTFCFLIAAVILFVKNDVYKKIGDLTGANARKAIKKINEEMQSNQERMEALSDNDSKINFELAGEPEKPKKKKRFSSKQKDLSSQDEQTDVLSPDEQTDLLMKDEVTSRLSSEDAEDILSDEETTNLISEDEATDILTEESTDVLHGDEATDILTEEGTDLLYGDEATDVLTGAGNVSYEEDATDVLAQNPGLFYEESVTDVLTDEATDILTEHVTETLVSNAETELLYGEIKISEGAFDSILNEAVDPDSVTEDAKNQENVFEIEEDITVVHTDDSI